MATPLDSFPQFVQSTTFDGSICLWHFPSRKHLVQAAISGCKLVVTLQGIDEDPSIGSFQGICSDTGMDWIQIDFWKNYYQHVGAVGHPAVIKLIDDIANRVREGDKVLLHCAAGIHRTGMCVYAVLRRLGLTARESVATIERMRRVTFLRCGTRRFTEMEVRFNKWFVDI